MLARLFYTMSTTLYKALIDEQIFENLINQIDLQIKKIEEDLTPKEKEQLEQYNSQ